MGYTKFTTDLIGRHLTGIRSVLDLGSQNMYLPDSDTAKPPFASAWYSARGIEYNCIDLAGDNGALKINLAKKFVPGHDYDMVVDAGTSEHVTQMEDFYTQPFHDGHIKSIYHANQPTPEQIRAGYFYCWHNKHVFCKPGGLIISENPKSGSWPDHGYSYILASFYEKLAKYGFYDIIELGEYAFNAGAINIYSVLRKKKENFLSKELFSTLPTFDK